MLELSASGARVLMLRSVEYARNHGVKLHVRSSFTGEDGTWIVKEEDVLEQAIVSGIAHDTGEAKVTILGVPDQPGVAARVFRPLADAGINIDMIVQNVSAAGHTDISFTLPQDDLPRAEPILTELAASVGAAGFSADQAVAKVSVVGAGMRSHPGVAADVFEALADAGINIDIISTSSIRVSCVVRARRGRARRERDPRAAPARRGRALRRRQRPDGRDLSADYGASRLQTFASTWVASGHSAIWPPKLSTPAEKTRAPASVS